MVKPGNSKKTNWVKVQKDMTKRGIEYSFWNNLEYRLGKDKYTSTQNDTFMALALAMRDRLIGQWLITQERFHDQNLKRVYYFSLEFLIGRLLETNIDNLGLWKETMQAMEVLGLDIEELRECEYDAGLGNGGLGRLAACFMDSMATLSIPAHGYGIRYDYGIFRQKIINGNQVEFPDAWLSNGNPWEFERPEYKVKVRLFGRTRMFTDENMKLRVEWVDTKNVLAMPYDIPVPGYKNDIVNTLRLWSARSTEDFDLEYFNDGDYERAVYAKIETETISKVLYPNDNVNRGKFLRLIQEYFFCAASLADIIRRFKTENKDLRKFPEKVAIQLNDTHPSVSIAELMRILVDVEGLDWDIAWDITVNTFAYTNHTVMPEAQEKWPVAIFENLLPRHLEIIYEINRRFLSDASKKFSVNNDILRRISIIEETEPRAVRMAYLAIIGSHSVNGVSELHSHLLKTEIFKDFYEIFPERFNNKTNGITERRWLHKANPGLSNLITETIGDKWVTDLYQTQKLLKFTEDASFRKKWEKAKKENKAALADYIYKNNNIVVNPESIFDVQVKRIHEYKRQLLFAFYIIAQYLRIKNNPKQEFVPRTCILGGKAAPGYFMAKLIIKFINNIAEVINKDKDIKDKLKVVFLENYRVSLAERIFPASDLSEQISTAGTEASGTGCMKFMLNGALTIGTYDGANIEIADAVGKDNIFIFGLRVEDINKLKQNNYMPQAYIQNSPLLKEAIKLINDNYFSCAEHDIFRHITDHLLYSDTFFICADFNEYCAMQDKVAKVYSDKNNWVKKSIINVAKSGKFSSDRTVSEYARDIWGVPVKA
ncbi:MAG: glycogen/starch/alpha-glucan phosphorylase [Candidatus Omnitrophica bacterium]|nr:glycogen/starch/alpha-glucan phosphorylase [Candidatus Omnitrophota bacterium]